MISEEETTCFVDRRESVLKSPLATQISANKSVIRKSFSREDEVSTGDTGVHGFCSSEDNLQSLTKTERSEVSIEIQGVRETTLSTSETVVTNRVRTVYDRSLSGSTSSTDLDHKTSFTDSSQGAEDSVFGDAGFTDEYQRERKTSDSYYISQTYQVNTEESPSKSVTAVRSVSFRSSKNFSLGDHDKVNEEQSLHFVDRLEEIIAGQSPEVVGSPKDNHVKFLWYDNDQEDAESLKRIQSARKDVQQLIESTYMVNDIADVVDDNYMGPESKHSASATSENVQLSKDYQVGHRKERKSDLSKVEASQKPEIPEFSDTLGAEHPDVAYSPSESSHSIYKGTVSASDVLQMINKQSFSSNEVTWGSTTSYSFASQRFDSTLHSSTKPMDFPQELKPVDSLSAGRSSPPTLAYSPGMAIRSYALEELAEKKFKVTPDRVEAEAKTLRFDEESSGVDLDKGSSVDGVSSLNLCSITELTNVQDVSSGSYFTESFTSQRYGASSDSIHGMSKEEEDESLDNLVDLESLLVGYRFHDVGIMQESEGICNLAFDDSDENENVAVNSAEYRSSSVSAQSLAKVDVSVPSSVSENYLQLSGTQRLQSAVESSSLSLPGAEESPIRLNHDTHSLGSVSLDVETEVKSAFGTENISHEAEFKQTEMKAENITTEMEQARVFLQAGDAAEESSETVINDDHSNILLSHVKVEHSEEQFDAPDSHFIVKELPSIVSAGEKKTTLELAQTPGKMDFEYVDNESIENQRQTMEVESITSSKEAETIHSIQVGDSSGSSAGVGDRHLVLGTVDVNSSGSVEMVETAALSTENKHATCKMETDKTTEVMKAENTAFIGKGGPAVSQVITGEVNNVASTGKVEEGGRKRKADKRGNKRKTDHTSITGKVDSVASKQADNFGSTGKVDNVASKRKDKAANKRKAGKVVSTGKAVNDGSTKIDGKDARTGNDYNIASIGQPDTDVSTRQIDNAASTTHIDNAASARQIDNAASTTHTDNAASTTHIDNAASTRHIDNAAITTHIDSAIFVKMNNNATNFKETENASGVTTLSDTTITTDIRAAAFSDNCSLSNEKLYPATTPNTEACAHTVEMVTSVHTKDRSEGYGPSLTESSLTVSSMRSQILTSVKSQSSSISETEDLERVLQALGPAELEIVLEEFRVAGVSNTLREYIRMDRLDVSSDVKDGYQSNLTEVNRRSEILTLLKNETSSPSETEDLERVLQTLGPAELEMVHEEFRVAGVSNTLREYIRMDRLDMSSDVKDGYQSNLTEVNRRSEILTLLKNETSSPSETEDLERVLQTLGPAELEMVHEEFRVAGVSNTLREYIRMDRLDMSSDVKDGYQSNLTEANRRSEILTLLKNETSSPSETEDLERVLQTLGPAELEMVHEEFRVAGVSNTLREYIRMDRLDMSSDVKDGYQSSLTEANRRSEILTLLKNETSSPSETEHLERVLQALGPAELHNVHEEFSVSGMSTTFQEYLRKDRLDVSTDGKVKSFLSKEFATRTDTVKSDTASITKVTALKADHLENDVSVTRRFNISSKFEASLKSMGAALKCESMSIAVYFDTVDFDLTLSDCWLRSVNSQWQFHANFTKLLNKSTKNEYIEIEDTKSILPTLADVLKFQLPTGEEFPIGLFIHKSGLREFVRYTTIRRTYTLRGMRIDLELPEYGFWVGSVTVEGSGSTPLHEAVRNVDSFWKTTGVCGGDCKVQLQQRFLWLRRDIQCGDILLYPTRRHQIRETWRRMVTERSV